MLINTLSLTMLGMSEEKKTYILHLMYSNKINNYYLFYISHSIHIQRKYLHFKKNKKLCCTPLDFVVHVCLMG